MKHLIICPQCDRRVGMAEDFGVYEDVCLACKVRIRAVFGELAGIVYRPLSDGIVRFRVESTRCCDIAIVAGATFKDSFACECGIYDQCIAPGSVVLFVQLIDDGGDVLGPLFLYDFAKDIGYCINSITALRKRSDFVHLERVAPSTLPATLAGLLLLLGILNAAVPLGWFWSLNLALLAISIERALLWKQRSALKPPGSISHFDFDFERRVTGKYKVIDCLVGIYERLDELEAENELYKGKARKILELAKNLESRGREKHEDKIGLLKRSAEPIVKYIANNMKIMKKYAEMADTLDVEYRMLKLEEEFDFDMIDLTLDQYAELRKADETNLSLRCQFEAADELRGAV